MYLSYPCRDALKIEKKTLYFVTFAYCCYVNYLDCGTVGLREQVAAIWTFYLETLGLREQLFVLFIWYLFGDSGTAGAAFEDVKMWAGYSAI